MIEVACQHCGQKVGVQSLLSAATQPCGRCGQLLMGPLARGTRTTRPPEFEASAPPPREYGAGSSAGVWLGVLVGVCAGIGLVGAITHLGPAIPWHVRNTVLGALAGVVLAPFLAVGSFVSMIIFPFGLEAVFGDSAWRRLAQALNERTLRPLVIPFLLFAGVPMAICAFGGARMKPTDPSLVVPAVLGAVALGAFFGAIGGALARRVRRAT